MDDHDALWPDPGHRCSSHDMQTSGTPQGPCPAPGRAGRRPLLLADPARAVRHPVRCRAGSRHLAANGSWPVIVYGHMTWGKFPRCHRCAILSPGRTAAAGWRRLTGGRPGALGYVHFHLTSRRCQASSVPGVTIRCTRRCLGSNLASAASIARSAQSGLGRTTCRCKTATSCRNTRISVSFAASLRASSTSQPNNRPRTGRSVGSTRARA
jgi:hypothetical protein